MYGRGISLASVINSPKYDTTDFYDVPFLDAAGILADNGDLTIFAINRNLSENLPVEVQLRGFENYSIEEYIVMNSDDPKNTNTEENPWRVKPRSGDTASIDGAVLNLVLPKLSWNVIRLRQVPKK
jgi:alpha-N-arabinofuranosidase